MPVVTHISSLGAIIALIVAIFLILKKVPPAYSMIAGALLGGLIGGADLAQTVSIMITGTQSITSAVLRILAAGILAGVLIESGAASTIASGIVQKLGTNNSLLSLATATLILTAVGVFIDVAVITVAPIALAIAAQANLSKSAILLAMVGGGKAGNLISPNPNAIAAAEAFNLPLTSIMIAGIIPAICGLIITIFLARKIKTRGSLVNAAEVETHNNADNPSFFTALSAPIIAISLLALRPIADIKIDPLIALPFGAIVGAFLMGKARHLNEFMISGLNRMSSVAIMLLGTGTISGVVLNSSLSSDLIRVLTAINLPAYFLAPISGIMMSLATASTTAGTVLASNLFSNILLDAGVAAIASAAMIHAGAIVCDHMPHGSFFHATGGCIGMAINERLKLIPYETTIGLLMTIVSMLIFGVFYS